MWFKNIFAFQIQSNFCFDQQKVNEQLLSKKWIPITASEARRSGFISHFDTDTHLVHSIENQHFITLRTEEKIIPPQALRDALAEALASFEEREQRQATKKEKQALKEETLHSMLPRAFHRRYQTHALLLPQAQLILIDASSRTKAEDLLSALRHCMGSFPVMPLSFASSLQQTLTHTLQASSWPHPSHWHSGSQRQPTRARGGRVPSHPHIPRC